MTAVASTPQSIASQHPAFVKFTAMEKELNQQFFERRDAIRGIILALLCKEHAFLLGTPGTGKTYLIREIMRRINNAQYFEAILSKTRPTEAVLGPYDIPKLRDHGNLVRKTQDYLPTSDLAMLDEVGKMPPTLGHDLLSIVLDRIIHQVDGSGTSHQPVPLHTFVGGSNELPTDESPDAAALWDRILVRWPVDEIAERANFAALLQGGAKPPANPTTLDLADLKDAAENVVPATVMPAQVLDVVLTLRDQLSEIGISPSSRRWTQAMKLPRASAFMEGRDEVEVTDLGSLAFALWDKPEDLKGVRKLTLSLSDPLAEEALQFSELVEEIRAAITDAKGMSVDNRGREVMKLNRNVGDLRAKVDKARQSATQNNHSTTRLDAVLSDLQGVQKSILHDLLGMSADS
jgi:MoxR-like ATPase